MEPSRVKDELEWIKYRIWLSERDGYKEIYVGPGLADKSKEWLRDSGFEVLEIKMRFGPSPVY